MSNENTMNYKTHIDPLFTKVKFDSKLLKAVNIYKMSIINRNQDHIGFFSGTVTGVHTLRFLTKDDYQGLFNLFGVSPDEYLKAVKKVGFFNTDYEVEGDPFNHLCVYISHRFKTSPYLDAKLREAGAIEGALIFLIRVVIILINARFRYPANLETARMVYEHLSNKYLIKQYKDWLSVLQYQAEKSTGKDGLHHARIITLTDPNDVRYVMTNMQTSVSSLLKGIYSVHMRLTESKERIKTTTMVADNLSGEMEFKETSGTVDRYITAISSQVSDKKSIVNRSLLVVISDIIQTADIDLVQECLSYIADNQFKDRALKQESTKFINNAIVYCYNYVEKESLIATSGGDYSVVLHKLKTGIMSAKSTNRELLAAREHGLKVISTYSPRMSLQAKSSIRTALILYYYLFAYSKVEWGK